MATRSGELSRSSGGHDPLYSLSPVATRREYGSQGGSRPAQTADSGEVGSESGWQVMDTRNGRSGRPWAKLFKHLNKLLDDIYLTCELDCSLDHVATMVEYLEASAEDFAELHSQLESVVSPSGQKVAWEVRSCRRASNRSPRMAAGPFGSGGSSSSRAQGPFSAAATAATAAATPGQGRGSWAAAASAAAATAMYAQAPGVRAVRRTASGGGAAVGSAAVGGATVGPATGYGGSEGGGGAAGGGRDGSPAPARAKPPAASSAPGSASGPCLGPWPSLSGAAASDSNPWKGQVNWSELFTRQQQRAGVALGAGGSQPPGASPRGAAAGSGAVGSAAVGSGFRLGAAPPPPRLKTRASASGNGSGSGTGSGEGSSSPTGGAASPLDSLYHKMLTSPSRKLSPAEVRRASEQRQARAEKARQAMVEEKLARLAQANQSRQTAKSIMEERAGAIAARVDSKIARSAELRQAHLAERVQKAVEETKKVAEVAFINQMLEQDKKLALQEKLEEGETRRRQALEALQQRGKGAAAAVEEAQERRKMLEAERREQLVDRQRRKMAAQVKLEEDRRAAAAAREAASKAQRAAAAEAAEARQRLRDVLSVRIEERLQEAAARRAQHLELIKDRAALGKDLYDRRTVDGCASSPRSPQSRYTRPPSPEVASAGAGGHPVPPPPPVGRPTTPPGIGAKSGTSATDAAVAAGASGAAPGHGGWVLPPSSPPPSPPAVAAQTGAAALPPGPGPDLAAAGSSACTSPLRSSDRSITLSSDPRRRLKGMRRRACKSLARLEAARPDFSEPPHLQALLDSPDGRELVVAWAQLVETAIKETAAAAVPAPHAATRAAAGCRKGAATTAAGVGGDGAAASSGGGARSSSGGSREGAAAGGGAGSSGGAGSGAVLTPAAAAAAAVKHLLQRIHTDLGGRSKGIALHAARPSGLLAALAAMLTAPAAAATSHPPQTSVQLMELLALLVTSSHQNAAWLLARGGAAPLAGLVRCGMRALDRYNGLAADEVWEEPPEARYLAALLQTLGCLCRTPFADQPSLHAQQEELVAYIVACGLIHRSTELFSLFDQPAANDTAPIPGYVLHCLALLEAITGGPCRRSPAAGLTSQKRWLPPAANGAAIALSFQETSMAGLPSLLTAVLLRAAPSCTPAEARPERLPPNFVAASACIMRVLNNIARLDLVAAQSSLGASDLRVVFFHLVGFLLSYCTNQWPTGRGVEPSIRAALSAAAAGPNTPAAIPVTVPSLMGRSSSGGSGSAAAGGRGSPAGPAAPPPPPPAAPPAHSGLVQLLNEVLLLIGYYGVLQPANQDVLLWGKSPTILQRLAEVPFPYFVEQQLYQVLMPTLVSVCYGSERACATLAQHMDLHLLQSYVQTMMRQFRYHPAAPTTDPVEQRQDTDSTAVSELLPGQAAMQAGAVSSSSSANPSSPPAVAAAATPLSPRRQLLHDLPISICTPGDDLSPSSAQLGGSGRASAAAASGSGGVGDDDVAPLPAPTADRYSLPQRFPPELLPQVLAFLQRQMPGAVDRSAESSLAAAVAAAAAAGRLMAAAPQMSSTPLAVLTGDGRGRKAGKKLPVGGAGLAAAAEATPTSASSSAVAAAAGPTNAAAVREAPAAAAAAAGATATPTAVETASSAAAATPAAALLTPTNKGANTAHSGGSAADSPALSTGAGGGSSGGRAGSSGASHTYSHHFRRYLDAADVPVPFAAGGSMGVRRHRLYEAAAAAAVAAIGEGVAGGGGGSSADGNNCARSYVSELSFGGYLTPSLHGDSRDGDPRSPGETRIVLDELDLEQYEQQRLDEQQHLDEQDVLLLDEPLEGGAGGRRRAAGLADNRDREQAGGRGGSGEGSGRSSPPDLGAGLLAVKKTKGRQQAGAGAGPSSAEYQVGEYSSSESTGVAIDAWWRQIGYQFGGEDAGSEPESAQDDEDDAEGLLSVRDSPSLSPMVSVLPRTSSGSGAVP